MKIILDKRRALIAGAVLTLLTAAPIAYAIFSIQLTGTIPANIHPASGARFGSASANGIACTLTEDRLSFTCNETDGSLGVPFQINASVVNPNHQLTFNATVSATSSNSTVATIAPITGSLTFLPQTTAHLVWVVTPINTGNTTLQIMLNETGP